MYAIYLIKLISHLLFYIMTQWWLLYYLCLFYENNRIDLTYLGRAIPYDMVELK